MSDASRIDHEVDLPGHGRTVVRDIPGPPNATPLLLLHGLGATARLNWGRCFRPLSRHFRVLGVDHRGHGRGLRTRRFRLERCADDAIACAHARSAAPAIAVGYSMGGPIASLCWKRHPKDVAGLVLCATSRHFMPRHVRRFARMMLPGAAAMARLAPTAALDRMRARMLEPIADAGLRARVTEEYAGHDPASVIQATHALSHFSSHGWIGQVDVPTSVVITTRDDMVPPERQRKLAAAIPGAEVFEVDGDHSACVTHERFAETLVAACQSVERRIAAGRAAPPR